MMTGMDARSWDEQADRFDDEPDHGLGDPETKEAWRRLLLAHLPAAPARVADLGCGTGTLARLLVDEGYRVDGVDFSPAMVARARAKVPESSFVVADAARPPLHAGTYDIVLCRHLLWALPEPASAVLAWTGLLAPGGRLVLVEGHWGTGAGLRAQEAVEIVRQSRHQAEVTPLPEAVYWGRTISDERYLLRSDS